MRAILSYWTMALACISLTDCGASSSTRSSAVPEFRDFYRQLSVTTATAGPAAGHGPRLTFSADGVNLVTFLRLLADKTGVSVVAAEDWTRRLCRLSCAMRNCQRSLACLVAV